jgi:2-keto-4-pentenoate hydratase/2-oxohepta-3-ene-1,7-dioic acid hydratase in catechol pathway
MKLCRFEPAGLVSQRPDRTMREICAESLAGILEGDVIREISGELWGDRRPTGRQWRVADVRFLPPSWPSKIICMAKNYVDHAAEMNAETPTQPIIFSKPPSAIIAPGDEIVMPRISNRVDYEGELAFIMGRRCFRPRPTDDIRTFIAGYTCLNDVTARDLQRLDGQYTRGKGFDTFCPFGPVMETDAPSPDATVETFVNGTRKQFGHVSEMVFPIDTIFRWIAEAMTLEPGDVIATGTPSGVGPLHPGDVVEVRISGIGTLRNPVIGPQD